MMRSGAKKANRELLLRRQFKPTQAGFDVILIDTPPAMRAANPVFFLGDESSIFVIP
jgi:cellulose biosynthesis protein BcsQ